MSVLQFWVTCGLRPGIFFSFLGPFLLHIVQVFSSKVSSVQAFNHKAAAHVLYCIVFWLYSVPVLKVYSNMCCSLRIT